MQIKKRRQGDPALNQVTNSPLLLNSLLEMLASATRQEKDIKAQVLKKKHILLYSQTTCYVHKKLKTLYQ